MDSSRSLFFLRAPRAWAPAEEGEDSVYLPERVELLPLGDGELPGLVLVDAIVKHPPLVQQAQGVGAIVVSGPDPAREDAGSPPRQPVLRQEPGQQSPGQSPGQQMLSESPHLGDAACAVPNLQGPGRSPSRSGTLCKERLGAWGSRLRSSRAPGALEDKPEAPLSWSL